MRSKYQNLLQAQTVFAIKQSEAGVKKVEEVCQKMGVSKATFYYLKKKYGGLGVSELRKMRQLEEESRHLKQLVADLSLDKQMLTRCAVNKPLRSALLPFNPPILYEYLDQKRKRKVRELQIQLAKLDATLNEIMCLRSQYWALFETLLRSKF